MAVGFGSYLYAMAKCIKETLYTIDKMSRSKNERKLIWEPFIEIIEFHSRLKQLSFYPIWYEEKWYNNTSILMNTPMLRLIVHNNVVHLVIAYDVHCNATDSSWNGNGLYIHFLGFHLILLKLW